MGVRSMVAFQSDSIGLVSHHSKLFEADLEQKRVDVARRLDERVSKLTCKILPHMEQQHALGRHRHEISKTSSLTTAAPSATTRTAKRLEQFSNQSYDNSICGASHDGLRLCGSADAPSTQTGRDVLRPFGSLSLLNTPRTEGDRDILFSCGSIPLWNTLRQQAKPHEAGNNVLYGHGVQTIHQLTQKSTVGGKHRGNLEFHIRKIHEIERKGSSVSETSMIDSLQVHSHGCVTVPAVNLDSSRSIKSNHSDVSSQSPHSVSEHPKSALSRVQDEETMTREVDVTQLPHQCNLTHERNLTDEFTCERSLREELKAEQMKVAELRLEVHATRQNLEDERERAASREQELMHEVGVQTTEGVPMQTNCSNCKNYHLKIGDLETALAEATRKHALAVDDCAELANLRLQLAHEVENRTMQERAYNTVHAEKEEYLLKFEKLTKEYRKQEDSLVEFKKMNVGLELQRVSNAEIDKQRQDMCDHQSALLRKLEAELDQTQTDLIIEREFVVRLHLQIQQLQLEVKRERERSSSQEIQLRDAFEEIRLRDHGCPAGVSLGY